MNLSRKKSIHDLMSEADKEHGLKRVLTGKNLLTLGIGAIIGAGSGVTGDIPAGKTMLGYPAVEARDALKQWAILKRLVNESKK